MKDTLKTSTLGQKAEEEACKFLTQKGLKLIAKNYRTPRGEIDLIMQDSSEIVFIEVRSRKNSLFGTPIETIHFKKQQKIIYTALIIPMIALGNIPLNKILVIIISSYGLKILYAFIMAAPATILVQYLKKLEGIDMYDYNVNFNPFIFAIESPIPEIQKEFDDAVVDLKKYKK